MKRVLLILSVLALGAMSLYGAGGDMGVQGQRGVNTSAIVMFLLFVGATLGITYWAAKRTKTAKDFYTAGGGITGFQNGLAIAGDYMSAASFLGISGMVYMSGYDGLIYSIGFLVVGQLFFSWLQSNLEILVNIHLQTLHLIDLVKKKSEV